MRLRRFFSRAKTAVDSEQTSCSSEAISPPPSSSASASQLSSIPISNGDEDSIKASAQKKATGTEKTEKKKHINKLKRTSCLTCLKLTCFTMFVFYYFENMYMIMLTESMQYNPMNMETAVDNQHVHEDIEKKSRVAGAVKSYIDNFNKNDDDEVDDDNDLDVGNVQVSPQKERKEMALHYARRSSGRQTNTMNQIKRHHPSSVRKKPLQKSLVTYELTQRAIKILGDDNFPANTDKNATVSTAVQRLYNFWSFPIKSSNSLKSLPIPSFFDRNNPKKDRSGMIILGMHRSGTSMFTGILKTLGYQIGSPLLPPVKNDNPRGYFELSDVVYQNDEFFRIQNVSYHNPTLFNPRTAMEHIRDKKLIFKHGHRALQFFNRTYPNNIWIQKDPRMCITLPTWLTLFELEPASVFIYRHPLECAKSLHRRGKLFAQEAKISVRKGLWMWIYYNIKAIQYSTPLCRVVTSQHAIMSNPLEEISRVLREVNIKCNIVAPMKPLTAQVIRGYVDNKLINNQHAKKEVLTKMSGNCTVFKYDSQERAGHVKRGREMDLYFVAMRLFCDMEHGRAFEDDYVFPELKKMGTGYL